jgi:hypothetical protein
MAEIEAVGSDCALVDDEDVEMLSSIVWRRQINKRKVYARGRTVDGKPVLMHRLIMGNPDCDVDHINGDGLDNRRENLRLATRRQNNGNQTKTRGTSRFKGVSWSKHVSKWVARCNMSTGDYRHLGCFSDEEAAARAYDAAAEVAFGEFALTNAKMGLL